MVQRVWQAAVDAVGSDRAHIATDSDEVAEVARGFGADVQMTSPDARCGTERIAEISERVDASAFVNVQGDDPFIPSSLITDSLDAFIDRGLAVCTPIFRMGIDEGQTPHIVKVTRSSSGRALYFSRSVIPHDRDGVEDGDGLWGHVGLYVYSPEAVKEYRGFGESELERREKLEQLRFLENDIPIATFVTEYRPRAIDVPKDLEALIAEGIDD
jgi:3-deoxy-manno-octulosonate cytidylyltransferase (CMP-KDO synthetase)